jgi:CRISPR-associated endonuclease Cas1
MHADNTNYTVIKNGVAVVSGTGPAIRVDNNQLVIRDGPQETRPLCLTRAEAARKLRHIVVCGHAGGFVTFDALRWLRDTGVAFSQLDWDGALIIASGPRGRDQPALRRAQALVCSGAVPKAAVAITREILRVKLCGQAEVARLMGSTEASAAIGSLVETIADETDGRKVLHVESRAAAIYWQLWENVPVRFARRNPQRLSLNGQWRPGRHESWLTFGPRSSLLTGKPYHASTPGNALLNYLYGVLAGEMTIALLAVGLDPGIGMFHSDIDRRASLALDAIEAVRPYVDYWLLAFLASAAFANRDFNELPAGEVRLSHPLNSHLACTAALWRKVCEPVADWLAQSFARSARSGAVLVANGSPSQHLPTLSRDKKGPLAPPTLRLPTFRTPGRGHQPVSLQAGLSENPVPRTCYECGKALSSTRRRFCSETCAVAFHLGETAEQAAALSSPSSAVAPSKISASKHGDADKSRRHLALRRAWIAEHASPAGFTLNGERNTWPKASGAGIDKLREWYVVTVSPLLVGRSLAEICDATELSYRSAILIRKGHVPHPRHYQNLAALVGVELPRKLDVALAAD